MDASKPEIRNAVLLEDGTRIDCEYNHPELGWIPFTDDPDDVSHAGLEIYQAALAKIEEA